MDEDQAIDGELVNDTSSTDPDDTAVTTTPQPDDQNSGQILINMESMIKNYIADIDRLNSEAKKMKEMLDDIFANDQTYQQHSEAAKDATKVKAQTRAEILKRPQAKELNDRVKTLKSEAKENQGALSDYLQEYARMSGVNEIEGEDGEVREIVYTAKLVRKSFKL